MDQLLTFISNHWDLFTALIIIIALLFGSTFIDALRGIKQVGPAETTRLINHEKAIVIDIREDKEFATGHIINSIHIPMDKVQERLAELEKHKSSAIIVSCRSGNRSNKICSLLSKNGFERVSNLKGGLIAWQNASMPVSKN